MIDRRLRLIGAALATSAASAACGPSDRQPRQPAEPPRLEPAQAAVAQPPSEKASPPPTDGLRLHGVLARGAIIAGPEQGQRLVPIGREVAPGLVLREVGLHRVVLAWADGTVELGFEDRDPSSNEPPSSPATGRRDPVADARREEALRYRFGLAPRREAGRITGFTVRNGADLPVLRRAGLRPGDVLVAVNGQSFDSEERVQELAGEIAGSFTAQFEFEREGRTFRTALPVNPRP